MVCCFAVRIGSNLLMCLWHELNTQPEGTIHWYLCVRFGPLFLFFLTISIFYIGGPKNITFVYLFYFKNGFGAWHGQRFEDNSKPSYILAIWSWAVNRWRMQDTSALSSSLNPTSRPLLLMKCLVLRTFFSLLGSLARVDRIKESPSSPVSSLVEMQEMLVTWSYLGVIDLSLCIRLLYLLPLTGTIERNQYHVTWISFYSQTQIFSVTYCIQV